jgi:hypothetical protein
MPGAMTPGREAFWPTADQDALLRAALLPGREAIDAWQEWKARNDLTGPHLDPGSFRLLPLVYRNLVALGAEDALLPRLKGVYRFHWCANQRLFCDAAALVEGLQAAGIRTLVLKGAALSTLHYRDRGARPMSDVDVLVPFTQAPVAIDRLRAMGWRTSQFVADDLRYRHAAQLLNEENREFDLHWHAFYECVQEDADNGLWRRAVPFELAHVKTLALDDGDTLLHTVAHGMRWGDVPTIRWIPDAMAVLRHGAAQIDWDRVLREATRRRLILRLHHGLGYLRQRFGAPIPHEVVASARARRPAYVERMDYRYRGLGLEERRRLVFGQYPYFLVDYLRYTVGWNPLRRALALPEYMRYRYHVESRTRLLWLVFRQIARRSYQAIAPGPAAADRSIGAQ